MPYALKNRRVSIPSTKKVYGTGWLPPMYDPRDFTADHQKIEPVNKRLDERLKARKAKVLQALPATVDLRQWCSNIKDQGGLGSCTAHAATGVVEYFQRRSFGKYLDGSRLFVYKTTRNLIGVVGDSGAWLRNTMGALALCGVPSESYWEYTDAMPDFDQEPPQFVYAVAENYEALKYFAHDPQGMNFPLKNVLNSVKTYLAKGIPSMFGFWGYGSFDFGDSPGHIPMPTDAELASEPEWGHAIVAIGYDDNLKITNTISTKSTMGALLIRNSWGLGWGQGGYGWMPYDYVLKRIALDFWSMLKMEWVDTEQFFAG
jgi:C1A family cysteine protease